MLQGGIGDDDVHPGIPVCIRAVHIRAKPPQRRRQTRRLLLGDEIFRGVRAGYIPDRDVLYGYSAPFHRSGLLERTAMRAGGHDSRSVFRGLFQPLAVV